MDLRSALCAGIQQLTRERVPSANLTAEVLLMHVLGRDRVFLHAHPEDFLTPEQERAYFALLGQRAAGKPTQYLTGHQEFWGLDFHVAPGVFIPRPETEHLVEAVLELVTQVKSAARYEPPQRPLRIVDVGTGTGCIAIALARELEEAEIFAVDISRQALELARYNARRLHSSEQVFFLQSDLLEIFLAEAGSSPFEFVVSNPPYVNPAEAAGLPVEVREHEPPAALFAEDAGLHFYRRLFEQAAVVLCPGGWLVVELGYGMSAAVAGLLAPASGHPAIWAHHELRNDLAGIPRVLLAQKRK